MATPGRRFAGAALLVEDVALDIDLQRRIGQPESARHRPDRDEHGRRMRVFGPLHRDGDDVVVAQNLHRALGAAGAVGDEEHGVAALPRLAHVRDPVADAAVELQRRLTANLANAGSGLAERQLLELGRRLDAFGQVVPGDEGGFGRRQVRAAAAAGVAMAGLELFAHANRVLGRLFGLGRQQAHAA